MTLLEADAGTPLWIAMVDADELAALERDFLAEIFEGRLTGIIVRGAFPASTMARVVEQLEAGVCGHLERASAFWRGRAIGPSLQHTAAELGDYFAEVRGFRATCAALFEDGPDFQTRVEELLAQAHAGRAISALYGPRGEPYATATIRGLVPGSAMHPHCDIDQLQFPAIRHLTAELDDQTMLSYFVLLAAPQSGGRLHVYALRSDREPGRSLAQRELSSEASVREVAAHGELVLPLTPGDLLLFDAGHYYHQVDRVGGARTRWTQGGFLSRSRDGASVYRWH